MNDLHILIAALLVVASNITGLCAGENPYSRWGSLNIGLWVVCAAAVATTLCRIIAFYYTHAS